MGFNVFRETGLLYDLSNTLPAWTPILLHSMTTAFFAWFLLLRAAPARSWMVRPPAGTSRALGAAQ